MGSVRFFHSWGVVANAAGPGHGDRGFVILVVELHGEVQFLVDNRALVFDQRGGAPRLQVR